ncbi:hypothetical protein KIPB_005480 [Kipferlia bialata]|uniref:Uncharacterized protein n=1 Tax=Kipferlia bialata TaxID=797122 RepID=A0A9K3CWS0_9EUKA|nr:hypothetical protein KIPB_003373 [Kipferlia bialata]GIQ84051.1 hypothetical protein KIPB_005480 [Kipferlia bialata]|eukprot:g3373.t1
MLNRAKKTLSQRTKKGEPISRVRSRVRVGMLSHASLSGPLDCLSLFPNLTSLMAFDNAFTEVSGAHLPNLIELDLSKNSLATYPLSLFTPRLAILRIGYNSMRTVSLPPLPCLRELDVSHQRDGLMWLGSVPVSETGPETGVIQGEGDVVPDPLAGSLAADAAALEDRPPSVFSELTTLDLSGNALDDEGLVLLLRSLVLPRLMILSLAENKISSLSTLSSIHSACPMLQSIDMAGCPVAKLARYQVSVFNSIPNVRVINGEVLSSQRISFLSGMQRRDSERQRERQRSAVAERERQHHLEAERQSRDARRHDPSLRVYDTRHALAPSPSPMAPRETVRHRERDFEAAPVVSARAERERERERVPRMNRATVARERAAERDRAAAKERERERERERRIPREGTSNHVTLDGFSLT